MKCSKEVLCQYWFDIFPSLKIFEEYIHLYFNHGNKPWQERWEFTDTLLDNIKIVMDTYHQLDKEAQKLPKELEKIQFLRAQCRILQYIRSDLVQTQHKGEE